jgi:hypothetical protein
MATLTIQTEADERAATKARDQHRAALTRLIAERDQATEERNDMRVNKAVGRKFDARRLAQLDDRVATIDRQIGEETIIVDGLDDRLRVWTAQERRRRYERDLVEMQQISASAPALEAAYDLAAEQLVKAANDLLTARERFRAVAGGVEAYRHDEGMPGSGLRPPGPPYTIPDQFLSLAKPSMAFVQWLRDRRRFLPGWR